MSLDFWSKRGRLAAVVLTSSFLVLVVACSSKDSSSTSTTAGSASSSSSTAVPNTPVSVPAWTPPAQATDLMADASTPQVVSYGSDPNQNLEVFQSTGEPQGTIVYVHGGAWEGGSMQQNTSAIIQAQEAQERTAEFVQLSKLASNGVLDELKPQLSTGWDIVSIDYRLATATSGPGIRATQLMNDVDHAMRYIVANAKTLDLDMSTFIISGGSAGGHLALMEALTAASGQFIDPTISSDLKKVKLSFDGHCHGGAERSQHAVPRWRNCSSGTRGTPRLLVAEPAVCGWHAAVQRGCCQSVFADYLHKGSEDQRRHIAARVFRLRRPR